MPVGRQSLDTYPKDYNPENSIELFKKGINDKSKIKLHCALRGKFSDDINNNYCNMLEEKIGVDCMGNVFACAWAGNLNVPVEDNPFYIGNLLDNDLDTILQSNKKVEGLMLKVKENDNHCRIFSYLGSTDKSDGAMFSQNDCLLKKVANN